MPLFFRLYERLRPLRYVGGFALLVLILAVLSHPVTFLILGLVAIAWACFWPLCVNDCFITGGKHRPEDFVTRMKLYAIPALVYSLYAVITFLDANYGIGLYHPTDINPHKLNLVLGWYTAALLGATAAHMIACTEMTYKNVLKGLR